MQRKIIIYLIVFLIAVFFNLYYYRQYLIEQWMRYNLNGEYIVVSLSTTPHRINELEATLQSIIDQNAPIKTIYLTIPYIFKRDNLPYHIPAWLQNNKKITILRTEDYGPATKLLGTLANTDLPNNAIIITLDDDVIYPRNLVLHLAYKAKEYPDRAIGLKGSIPDYDDNGIIAVDSKYELGLNIIRVPDAQVSVLHGYAGIAYRRSFFDNSVFAISSAPEDCIKSDDIYFAFYLAKHNIPRQVLRNNYISLCDLGWENAIGTNATALHRLIPAPIDKHRSCIAYLKQSDPNVIF